MTLIRRVRTACRAAAWTLVFAAAASSGLASSRLAVAGEPEALRVLRDRARVERQNPKTPGVIKTPPGLEALAEAFPEMNGLRDADLAAALARLKPDAPPKAAEPVDDPTLRQSIRLYVRGQTALVENVYSDAMKDLAAAGELNPSAPEPWEMLAQAQARAGRVREAVLSLKQAYDVGSTEPGTLMTYWRALRLERRWEESAAVARRLRESAGAGSDRGLGVVADTALGESLLSMGAAAAGAELIAEALERAEHVASPRWVEESSELVRRRAELWTTVGDTRLRLGKLPEAVKAYERAQAEPGPDTAGLMERRVFALLRSGYVAGAATLVVDDRTTNNVASPERTGSLIRVVGASDPAAASMISSALAAIAQDEGTRSPTKRARLLRSAAAGLEPQQARELLLSHLERLPERGLIDDLLGRLAPPDRAEALTLAGEVLNRAPGAFERVGELVSKTTDVDKLVAARGAMKGEAGLPGADAVVAMQLIRASQFADAKRTAEAGDRAHAGDPRWLFWRVKIAAVCADWDSADRAITGLSAAAERDPRYSSLAARALSSLQRPDEALAMYERGLAAASAPGAPASPTAVTDLLGAADLAQWLGREALSEAYVMRAASADSQAEVPRLRLLEAAGTTGEADRDRLASMIRELREISPQSRGLRLIRARELLRARQYGQALGEYSLLLGEDPDDEDAGAGLLTVAMALPTTDPALVRLRTRVTQLCDAARSSAWPALTDGALAIRMAKDDAGRKSAAESLDVVLNSHYDGDVLRLWAALTREALGAEAGAKRVVELLAAYPPNADVLAARAAAHTQLTEMGAAATELDALPAQMGLRPAQVASLLTALEAPAEAAVKAIGRPEAPSNTDVRRVIEQVFTRAGRLTPALHAARLQLMVVDREFDMAALVKAAGSAAAQVPNPGAVHRGIVDVFQIQGMSQAAVEFTRLSAADEAPGSGTLHVLWMTSAALWGSAEDTAAAVRAACGPERVDATVHELVTSDRRRTTPNLKPADIAYEMANLLALRGMDDATMLYELALEYDRNHRGANNDLGYTLLERDVRREDATRMIELAYKTEPDDPNVLDSYGWLRYLQGRFADDGRGEGAATILQRAVKLDEDNNATLFDHLGDALYRAGDRDAAIKAWEQAYRASSSLLHREGKDSRTPAWRIRKYTEIQTGSRRKQTAAQSQNSPPLAPTWAEIDGTRRARPDLNPKGPAAPLAPPTVPGAEKR